MLNGIAPILLFRFFKTTPPAEEPAGGIPIVSNLLDKISLPVVPLYLDEGLSGIYVQSESKSLEIETKIDSKTDSSDPNVNQKALGSTVSVEMVASQGSLGVTILVAFADLIIKKVTAGEYSVSYLNNSIVLIDGLLQSLSVEPEANSTLYRIRMTLTLGKPKEQPVGLEVPKDSTALPLSAGSAPGPASVPSPPAGGRAPLPPPPPPSFNLGGLG